MTTPARFDADDIYCVYCHAPAAGACGTCRALVCADCSVLVKGSVHVVAVCRSCHREGRAGAPGWRGWWSLLWPWLLGLGLLALLVGWLSR